MRSGSVDVALILVERSEGRHVLLPAGVALHDQLVAHVEAHGPELLLELGRHLGLASSDAIEQSSEDRVRKGSVHVARVLVVIPESGHVRVPETLVRCTCFALTHRHQPPSPLPASCAVEAVDERVEL